MSGLTPLPAFTIDISCIYDPNVTNYLSTIESLRDYVTQLFITILEQRSQQSFFFSLLKRMQAADSINWMNSVFVQPSSTNSYSFIGL